MIAKDVVRISPAGGQAYSYTVAKTDPAGPVVIEPGTVIRVEGAGARESAITYEDIGGLSRQVRRVREMIELPLMHPEVFLHLGIEAPKGVLLYGPPGTGKTLIARAVAHEVGVQFFHVNGPEIIDKLYGQSEAHLRNMFKEAEAAAPAIIFIDEIDAIAPKRAALSGERQVERRVVAQLLALMDGLKSRGQITVIAATNMADELDPALRRPGRFDREIEIGVPDAEGRLRFNPLAELCKEYHTHLGVWLSPFGGYGTPKEQRLEFGREQGYEINAAGFSLAGPKYYAAFKQSCVDMIRNFGVNHFKFDGIAAGTYASGGDGYILDTEAMRRLMLELRQEDPHLYINLTTGSWPSPFWLRYADSLWRQGDDMGFAGKGTRQQQWLTYRDQETYRNVVRKAPLFPLNSLMTQGVAYSRQGPAGDPTFDSAGFKDDVRAFFGSGTGLQELYIQPGKLSAADWRVPPRPGRWSRTNADALVDSHWIGGDPSRQEVYGYASWSPRKGI